jgi:hypothetical protein
MRAALLLSVIVCGCLTPSTGPGDACAALQDADARDACNVNAATEARAPQDCMKVSNPDLSADCAAAASLDAGLCDNISDGHWRDDCYYRVAVGLGNQTICSGILGANYRSGCFRDIGGEASSNPLCSNLWDRNETLWCYAAVNGDPSFCRGITDEFWMRRCLTDSNATQPDQAAAIGGYNASSPPKAGNRSGPAAGGCGRKPNPIDRDACLLDLGLGDNNASACAMIGSGYWRTECLTGVAKATSDPLPCALLNHQGSRDECYTAATGETG